VRVISARAEQAEGAAKKLLAGGAAGSPGRGGVRRADEVLVVARFVRIDE
jgi:hypothetical protein